MSQRTQQDRARFRRLTVRPAGDPSVVRTRVTLGSSISSAVGAAGASVTYSDIQTSTDFATFATLYKTYRVVGMEFEVFDQVPTSIAPTTVGTVHTAGLAPTPSASLVQDLPNAKNIQPYGGASYFYWFPNNVAERQFVDTTSNASNFGGLAVWNLGGTAQTNKIRVLSRIIVEFKDRI